MLTDENSEWGEYVEGGRLEIEPVDHSPSNWSGWGPSTELSRKSSKRWLVQRDRESPHPITWHSPSYLTADIARTQCYELTRTVPHLTYLAFLEHNSPLGSCSDVGGSLMDCPEKKCYESARATLKAIASDADVVKHMLLRLPTAE